MHDFRTPFKLRTSLIAEEAYMRVTMFPVQSATLFQEKLISTLCGAGQSLDGGPRGADALPTARTGHVGACLLVRLSLRPFPVVQLGCRTRPCMVLARSVSCHLSDGLACWQFMAEACYMLMCLLLVHVKVA